MRPTVEPHDKVTRSSWLLLGVNGGPCDRACGHCFYYHEKPKVFFDAETLCMRANKFRHYYGLERTDITGGEPTIYRDPALSKLGRQAKGDGGRNEHLEYLVPHCARIGLAPSVITHGQRVTKDMAKAIEDCGLDTWEFSMHGLGPLDGQQLGEGHRKLVLRHGGKGREEDFAKLVAGADACTRPKRFNTTVVDQTHEELPDVARFLVDRYEPFIYNMIFFMPYHQHAQIDAPFQIEYDTAAPHIAEAVHIAQSAGWEVNVRYFPPCVGKRHGFARNCVMHYQIQYDPREWDITATSGWPQQVRCLDVKMGRACEAEFWAASEHERRRTADALDEKAAPALPAV